MGLLTELTTWTTVTFAPMGLWGLFILGFIEASFFPIPADILLAVLVLEGSISWWLIALICALGSALGGIFGYLIGYIGEESLLKKFFSEKKIMRYQKLLAQYEILGVFIAGLTPVPYKLATIGAGVFHLNFWKFTCVSIFTRFLRYFAVAWIIFAFGEPLVAVVDKYLLFIAILSTILFMGYIRWKQKIHKKHSR